MNRKKEKVFMGICLLLCVLLFLERLTGEIWHAALGLILVILVVWHSYRLRKAWKGRKSSVKALDVAMIVVMAALVITGILAHPLHDVPAVRILHRLCAVLFVFGMLAHAVQHGKLKRKKAA